MKYVAQLALCFLIALPIGARSGGGHGGGGGFHDGAGGGFHGGSGGFRGGLGAGRIGGYGNGYIGGHHYGYRFNYWPGYYGYGLGLWGYGLGDYYDPYYDYDSGYYSQPYDYGYQPPVVIYQQAPQPAYPPPPVRSEIREYPEYSTGQPTATIGPAGEPPIYLIAIKGQDNILAGITYWVEGSTLQYINLQHVQKQIPLASVDRTLTQRLNHERNMDMNLPPA